MPTVSVDPSNIKLTYLASFNSQIHSFDITFEVCETKS
jgi:hypothetical protein